MSGTNQRRNAHPRRLALEGLEARLLLAAGTGLISKSTDGVIGNSYSNFASVSDDGRFAAFVSHATNLVGNDTNGYDDIFVRDRQRGRTKRVSLRSNGAQANGDSNAPAISADGRFVVFASAATNLVAGDTNGADDVFIHDRQTGRTTRVSVRANGAQGNRDSLSPDVNADGRHVAFESDAGNLVNGDSNGETDVFVRDLETGTTQRVSLRSNGAQGNNSSSSPAISGDGRYVAFQSWATNLVAGDAADRMDVFVCDRQTGKTTRVSRGAAGEEADDNSSAPSLSADGRYVAFDSRATNLVAGDTNGKQDVFVYDRRTGLTKRVSVGSGGAQADGNSYFAALSADGKSVAFESDAANLAAGDANGKRDVFVYNRATGRTRRASVNTAGTEGNGGSWSCDISANGRTVVFTSSATNLVAGDTNANNDIYVRLT